MSTGNNERLVKPGDKQPSKPSRRRNLRLTWITTNWCCSNSGAQLAKRAVWIAACKERTLECECGTVWVLSFSDGYIDPGEARTNERIAD
jgi:hypothetical protein